MSTDFNGKKQSHAVWPTLNDRLVDVKYLSAMGIHVGPTETGEANILCRGKSVAYTCSKHTCIEILTVQGGHSGSCQNCSKVWESAKKKQI